MTTSPRASFFRQSGWLMIATVVGGVFMLAVHLLAHAMPKGEYGQFVAFLSVAMFIPASGYYADRFGAKRMFRIAIGVFTAGSILVCTNAFAGMMKAPQDHCNAFEWQLPGAANCEVRGSQVREAGPGAPILDLIHAWGSASPTGLTTNYLMRSIALRSFCSSLAYRCELCLPNMSLRCSIENCSMVRFALLDWSLKL